MVDWPGSTLVGVQESDVTEIGITVRVALAVEAPMEAVIEAVCWDLIKAACAGNVAELLPEGTVTGDVTLSTELLAARDTTAPVDEATPVSVTVQELADPASTVVGTQLSEEIAIEGEGCSVTVAAFETPP